MRNPFELIIFIAQMNVIISFSPSLACLPSTKKQKECVNAAKQDYHVKLTAFITACVGQTTNTQNGV